MSRQHALSLVGMAVALVAVLGGSAVAYLDYRTVLGPAAVTRRYFAALAGGDAPTALAYAVPTAGSHALLTSAVLAAQLHAAPLRDLRVGSAEGSGNHATVPVDYRLDFPGQPERVSARVGLQRRGGRWEIAQPTATVTLDFQEARDRALVAGRRPTDRPLTLFPGALPVRFDTPYLQLFVNSRSVAPGTRGRLPVSAQLSAAGRSAVLRNLVPILRRCVQGPGSSPTCPLPSDRYVPDSLRGRLVGEPAGGLTLSVTPGKPGAISIGGSVRFSGSYELLSFDNLATRHTGNLTIPVFAQAFPVKPLRIRFQDVT